MASTSASTSSLPLPTPTDNFSFPYAEPYSIQLDLMRHVYSAIEGRAAAVVESPTGTGKSLSLICSSLSWLRDDASRSKNVIVDELRNEVHRNGGTNEPKWLLEQEVQRRLDEYDSNERELEDRLQEIRRQKKQREQEMKDRARYARKRPRIEGENVNDKKAKLSAEEMEVEQFAPDVYEDVAATQSEQDGISPAVRAMMETYNGASARRKHFSADDADLEPSVRKIYFTSRTHSQLHQFQNELRKTAFAEQTRTIALGSRQNLCINDKVREAAKGSVEALNDKCLDLQKADKGKRCQYLPPIDEPERLDTFRDHALSSIHSIEDLEDLGRTQHTCPYYGSRRAIRQARLVTLPYNLLLLKSSRMALGIDITDNIVIVDEAHNLIDTILSIHSVQITATQLTFAKGALLIYLKRFKTRLKGSNATYLKQLVAIMNKLDEFCKDWTEKKERDQMLTAAELVQRCKADQVNLRALDKYLTESKIAQKISGYMENLEDKQEGGAKQSRSSKISSIHRIQTFLLALANSERDGRVLLTTDKNGLLNLKYQLLNPSESFSDFSAARSIIIAGGTMAPLSDFAQQLLSYLPAASIRNLSCSHVVPGDHILVKAIGSGPSGTRLEFKYEQRGDLKMLDEYGAVLSNIANLVSKGTVVFVPSYAALDLFTERWQKTGVMEKLRQKKAVFMEPNNASETDAVLKDFAAANAEAEKGGLLLAVVGAKLSEGINFQDDLCRCVVVIGIPYPSSQSTELNERMKYVSSLPASGGQPGGEQAGKRLYANLAFRAVNQSIGRSIRHINDWSAIVLLDARYTQTPVQAKLPTWISENMESPATFGGFVKSLAAFMKARRAIA